MGRPEPCVLFAQSFIHSQLDEYVDEVLFAEPIVITACEFLEQNASPSTSTISLIGATSPPSFALEVFVQCEGESRFRRLCQSFLYSHSSSNVLEVEAVVTNHLVVRGSYRSLTLVVYGNTAEDLGQFNVDFDLDTSLANLVCSPLEGKLEDLPPALRSTKLTFEESIFSLKSFSFPVPELDLTPEIKQFLQLVLKICKTSDHEDTVRKVVSTVVSAVCSFVTSDYNDRTITWNQHKLHKFIDNNIDPQKVIHVLDEARNELLELYKTFEPIVGNEQSFEEETILGPEADIVTSELLVYMFNQCFPHFGKTKAVELSLLSQMRNVILELGVVLLLCSSRESCFCFVNGGGMGQISNLFSHEIQKPTAITLMLLGVVEHATRHAIGCEGFLGWWPREDENVPIGNSDGYCHLLKLLLGKQRHDVASLATYVLHRLRSYEIASRYESAVLSVLANLSADSPVFADIIYSLVTANSHLKQILKLLYLCGPIEDPSPVAFARKLPIPEQPEEPLSYRSTINLIASSKYTFAKWDFDKHLLLLLKERGFFPLSAALLSSPILRSLNGSIVDIFLDIASSVESILLSLLFCRSGLTFLLVQPEATATLILSLRGVEDMSMTECISLRQASVLMSKGFFCRPQDVGMITELHLRVGNAIDRLLATTPHSDELLWVLWELCAISRSDSGRQALLALGLFPEAVSHLMEALRSFKDLDPVATNSGSSPLSLAIFHSAAEIFEIMVTDSTASSLNSWIGHAVELHKALHSSSPGSNKKDAPTRLLEWIDAGVVYHRNGATGLLRYAAVLASGGDAHLTSSSVLVSDSMDVENVVGDSTNTSNAQVVDNLLGKLVSDKYFDGVTLHNTSIVQLTTTFRILAFISENSAVTASLFEEGAMTLIYVVLVNCKFMLERSSNTYDYLVDEGAESNSTSDLLLERSHEQSLVDLMIPCLVLLINLLQKLQEAKEQYRNKKLLNALLHLHREVSPKLAACAADLSFPYPNSSLGFDAVCHLLASALACWPVFGWTPGLFHCLFESVQATSSLALGPKDACSMLCLLVDLFPEEGIWLWKDGMPPLSALRTLSIGTILGPEAERDVDWYLQPEHLTVLLIRLTPQLDRIAQIVLHFSFTALAVIQDMLRVFIIRLACQRTDCAVVLLRPIILWMDDHVYETSLTDIDIFKVHKLLDFVASLLEHPRAKTLLLKVGAVGMFVKVLQRCSDESHSDGKLTPESKVSSKSTINLLTWSLPVFKSLGLIFDSQSSIFHSGLYDKCFNETISIEDSCIIVRHLLKLCQVLPVGRELLACTVTFKELASCNQGRSALASIFSEVRSSPLEEHEPDERDTDANLHDEYNWRWSPPFLNCWKKLLRSLDVKDDASTIVAETVYALSLSAMSLAMEGENSEGVSILKCLFGLPYDPDGAGLSPDRKLKTLQEFITLLDQRISEDDYLASSNNKTTLHQVKEAVQSLFLLLQSPAGSIVKLEGVVSSESSRFASDVVRSVVITSKMMPSLTMISTNNDAALSFSHVWNSNGNTEKAGDNFPLRGLGEKLVWECPDSSPDRQLMPALPVKRKLAPVEGPGRRLRDNSGSEAIGQNAFSRGLGAVSAPSGPTRRDTFRQRKPNTSRPPSMHVDDYVARERNVDGVSSGSNVVSAQRGGSTSGRPPSIHVDEFMARQRERQNSISVAVGDAAQVRSAALDNGNDPDKLDKSRQLKADLDDDLQEIDIVFDEESESDDRLPFPQPDDNLQPAPVINGERSPGSIVEETEGDTNETTRFSRLDTPPASEDGGSRSDLPLRRSVSRPEMPMAQEVNGSLEKDFPVTTMDKTFFREQSDESKYVSPVAGSKGFDALPSANPTAFPSQFFNVPAGPAPSSLQPLPPHTFYQRGSPQKTANGSIAPGSQGFYEQKLPLNQPPLPPMPPPPNCAAPGQTTEPLQKQSSPYGHSIRDVHPPLPAGYPQHAFDVGVPNNVTGLQFQSETLTGNSSTMPLTSTQPILDSKYTWNTVSSGSRLHVETYTSNTSTRPMPPLPPMPPPFSTPVVQSSTTNSGSQSSLYNQSTSVGAQHPPPSPVISDTRLGLFSSSGTNLTPYSLPPYAPSLLISTPAHVPGTLFSSPTQQTGQNSSSFSQPVPSSQPPIQSVLPRPPPPPPPQSLRPPHPQHHGPPIRVSQSQPEPVMPLQQNSIQVQLQPLQVPQQLHLPQIQVYYQSLQQEHLSQPLQPPLEHAQPTHLHLQADSTSQLQKDPGMTLQQYFASPEAIQSLLSDRDKLCQLLEQHPKLMQMLQERLGQL